MSAPFWFGGAAEAQQQSGAQAFTLTAEAGAFVLGGGFVGYVMPAGVGAFTLTGQFADLEFGGSAGASLLLTMRTRLD